MDEMKGLHIIRALQKKWIAGSVIGDILLAAAVTIICWAIAGKFSTLSFIEITLFFLFTFLILFFSHRVWKIKERNIAKLLDQQYPQLQESSSLLLKTNTSLNLLEQLQVNKTEAALSGIAAPLQVPKKLKAFLLIFLASLATGFLIYKLPFSFKRINHNNINNSNEAVKNKIENKLPQIEKVSVTIKPPSYTSRPLRKQDKFNLSIEEGSFVNWRLTTTLPVKNIHFIFNDSLTVALHAIDSSHTAWTIDKIFLNPGFYQLKINEQLSELYQIETIHDQAPIIHIQSPKQYTTIDFGQPQQALTRAEISDDYGINETYISATISSGSGEAVKFKEQKIALPGFSAGKTQYNLQKLLSLPSLGMQPGDELYFYIAATDNHRQETRSDIYIINLPDTAELMSLDGLANGINIKPEYFRSQRQIIIETEQLLKDKDTISAETFKKRSNNLGIDQKLLRLRYGKFLGEEDEFGEIANDSKNDLSDPANFSNAEKVKEAFTDQHDQAEDATFFEPELKKQLKATLTEMWNSELQLRVFKPQEALPFEYKALRLLKDLQQKSRAYVAKTNFKTTPLDPAKRLTGELDKIISPVLQKDFSDTKDPQADVRNALAELEKLKANNKTKDISQELLRQANLQLNEKATKQPALYISSVQSLQKIVNALNSGSDVTNNDILIAEKGLNQLLLTPANLPASQKSKSSQQLSKQYFINLQRKQ